ncbi:sigma-70 family RNA polymerase sigma factor [uncultured Aquimarina sp.]|uniref:RNA polymerase sigma factor n=1 Tax=uncultured Aquimarina sp. TaxID=575652 RepID=UPI0026035FB5|nr:sigma-70 family RNA polymerase sigma factor [uncultured Aquimarina sp.]
MKNDEETSLINGIKSGDEKVLKSFYLKYFPWVKNYILRRGGGAEDAEDIFQEALLILYLKLRSDQILIHSNVGSFFLGICKKLWLNYYRKNKKWDVKKILTEEFSDENDTVDNRILQIDRENLFWTYFNILPDFVKQVLKEIFEGKGYQEIALNYGTTESYLRKIKCETKKKLIDSISNDPLFKELI